MDLLSLCIRKVRVLCAVEVRCGVTDDASVTVRAHHNTDGLAQLDEHLVPREVAETKGFDDVSCLQLKIFPLKKVYKNCGNYIRVAKRKIFRQVFEKKICLRDEVPYEKFF